MTDLAKAASAPDGTIIMTYGTKDSMISHLPLLLNSMQLTGSSGTAGIMTEHLLVVALGSDALQLCLKQHRWCARDEVSERHITIEARQEDLETNGHARFGSPSFFGISWRKMHLTLQVLNAGLSVIALDMDMVIFRNFLDNAVLNLAAQDILLQHEAPGSGEIANVGFYFIKPSISTLKFMQEVLNLHNSTAWEQAAFNNALHAWTEQLNITWRVLPDDVGVSYCMLRHHGSFLKIAELQTTMQTLLQAGWNETLAFFHCACWVYEFEYDKPQAMHAVAQTVAQFKAMH